MNLKEQNSKTYLEIIGQPGQEKKKETLDLMQSK